MAAADRQAPIRFLRTLFEPTDWVAIFLKSYDRNSVVQRVGPVSWVQTERFQRWLRAMNAKRYNTFVSVNAIAVGRRVRTRDAIGAVRHVFLDADADASAVLARIKHWHRLEEDVKMLTESGGAPVGRVLSTEEQDRLLEVAKANAEWQHVYCAAVLAANTSMRGVEIKHIRRKDVDLDANALHIRKSKNEGSKRVLPLNDDALSAVKTMIERADQLGHAEPEHYLWCASQHHKLDPSKPAEKWDTAWRALRDAAGLPKLRFHDLRHTVVTRLLEAGEPDHVVESITGHLSRRMLEHYSHIRLAAKKQALDRLTNGTKRRRTGS